MLPHPKHLAWFSHGAFRVLRASCFVVAFALPLPVALRAQDTAPVAEQEPGIVIGRFDFSYGLSHPELPPLDELKNLSVRVKRDGDVFRAPADGAAENLRLGEIPGGARFDSGALRGIAQDVVRWYNERDIYGVWVAFTDLEAPATGLIDNRAADNQSAQLVVWASQISEVRTLARGKRVKPAASINNRKHRRIAERSPLRPGSAAGEPGGLFRQSVLNRYLYGMSLHPGRRLEASIASAGEPGKVVLDFLVNESKSWQVFSQANNYGTESTGEIRLRLGFQHNQLTNRDDIFNIDAIGTPDAKTYGTFLSYRLPVLRPARLLARVYGSYGDFLANGASVNDVRYTGQNWLGGLELSNNLSLWRGWQLNSALGAQYTHYGINSLFGNFPLTSGESDFLVPYLSATASRDAGWWNATFGLRFDHTLSGFANEDPITGITKLGRLNADIDWTSARWNLGGALYLDSLFQRGAKFQTLAHEASLKFKGRVLLRGERLIPHEQEPMGGALSIRGYPESVISADEFVSGTFEYAWHIPRSLKPGEPGKFWRWPFKWRATQPGQLPDWDLAVRIFYDYGYRSVTPIPPDPTQPDAPVSLADTNVSLSGFGGGLSLLVKQNFSLRADYGVALGELRDPTRAENQQVVLAKGNSEVYVTASFSW
jgi:hemolysin activation/secretion protein